SPLPRLALGVGDCEGGGCRAVDGAHQNGASSVSCGFQPPDCCFGAPHGSACCCRSARSYFVRGAFDSAFAARSLRSSATLSASTSRLVRFSPLCSYSRGFNLPTMVTRSPLLTDSATFSAMSRHAATR